MITDSAYEMLRLLASPLAAVTSAHDGRPNGMILDSAVRASISPRFPRLSVYVHKWHLSHAFIRASGAFALHLLRRDQFDLVHRFGFRSGRDGDKLAGLAFRYGETGAPVLPDCYAAFECRVVNAMDAGASTLFLGDIVTTHQGTGTDIMTAEYFRANLPSAWQEEFLANYRAAQEQIAQLGGLAAGDWRARTG